MKTLLNFVAILSFTLLMLAFAPAHAASFGRSTAGTIASGGLRADFKRGSKFVLSEKAMMNGICAYLDGKGGGSGYQEVRWALYRDNHGVPGDRITETDQLAVSAGDAARWMCASSAIAPLDPGTYWILIHTGSDAGVARYFYDGPANWYGNFDEYADGPSDTFGAGGAGEGTISTYVEYRKLSELHIAGTTTVGSAVSGPMSGGFKRGSSFQLTEKADLDSISIYVDGLGGGTGAQLLSIGIYDDLNGEPAALVTKGWALTGTSPVGRKGRWVTATPTAFEFNDPQMATLMPGRYWIVIQSGSPGGVFRYYTSGQGNWRGNASPGDVPPPFFGKANPGDGTISAFILYTPSQAEHKIIGVTTPGTIPSGGLKANFIRGSLFGHDLFFSRQTEVTSLWAYLDGNGGATGSQKVRLALYEQPLDDNDRIALKVVSDVVTIAAGTPPGWVRFPVPYKRLFDYTHGIMILTSGPGGVVRNYSSNASNWYGQATDYTQGAPGLLFFYPDAELPHPVLQQGDVTISAYAEYLVGPY
jgi:hypothetical protein